MSAHKISCPVCGSVFSVDQAQYAALLSQVRDDQFSQEVERRVQSEKERMVLQETLERTRLSEAASKREQSLLQQIQDLEHEKELQRVMVEEAQVKALAKQKDAFAEELQELKTQLSYYKDLKSRMSTKMVGESLEQHCQDAFNQIRMAAFPNAYFEKDNDSRTGSKGDFIFREMDGDTELLSIMFEMKHEMDTTATKHKNEDFLKELDKDRREKGCEYAVLVSLLEADSELYNQGIVDVSYRYPKMYVVRPQCFIPMITILRNAALRSLDIRRELKSLQDANLDVVRFADNLCTFKDYVTKNYDLASRHFEKAIEGIDKTIAQLEKIKKELQGTDRNLSLLTGKTENLTLDKLTKQSPSVRQEFVQAGIPLK